MDSAVSQARSAAQAQKSLQQRTTTRRATVGDADGRRRIAPSNASAAGDKQGLDELRGRREGARRSRKDQRELAEQVKKLQQTAAALEQQLKQAGALDSALARQLQEAQAMLRDALTPELLAQMQKLENATQQLSASRRSNALKDLQAHAGAAARAAREERRDAEARRARGRDADAEGRGEGDRRDSERALADSAAAKPNDAQKADAKQLADARSASPTS